MDDPRQRMKPLARVGVVAGGYVAAALIASVVVAVRIANTSGPDAQASSGMYAFGDAVVFVAVFGVCALVPAGAALVFLRPYSRFWTILSTLALVVAATGIAACILYSIGRQATTGPLFAWGQFSVLRILVAPVLALTFLVCAVISPYRSQRLGLFAATVMEGAVCAYAAAVWFVPMLLDRSRP